MIFQKDKEMTRFGIPRTHICPWVGKVTMASFLFTFVWGCGGPEEIQPGDFWEPSLKEIALQYAADAEPYDLPPGHLGRIYSMRFDTAKVKAGGDTEDTIGICIITQTAKKGRGRYYRGEIYIEEGIEGEKLTRLMYHELTHCVYDQDHWGEEGDIQYPKLDTKTFTWEDAKHRLFTELQERLERP